MADRITHAFNSAETEHRTALAPFVTIGHPARDSTLSIIKSLSEAGADVIELGMPFSDPLAEGPVIQKSSHRALINGITPQSCLDNVADIRRAGIETPIALMGYYNPMLQMGLDTFCNKAKQAGVDGIIGADLPAAESGPLLEACAENELALVPLLALTSTEETIRLACRQASGFIYCISVLGVTGVRTDISAQVEGLVRKVRSHTDLPVAVGFGISTAEQVRQVGAYADGAVVGSALVNALHNGNDADAPEIAARFLRSLSE